jgi:hypothetical protein
VAPHEFFDLLHHFLAYAEHRWNNASMHDVGHVTRILVRADQTMTAMARFAALLRPGRGRHCRR